VSCIDRIQTCVVYRHLMESFLREGGIATNNLGDSHFFEDTDPPIKIKSYLSSTNENEKLKGMKHLLALLSQGGDISEYFPDVVKNVSVGSVEVKKLVYIYLVHYADFNKTCRELALLSVNSFQKDLAGGNQLIRGLALRVMSSIRVPDLIQIQILAIRKCSTDRSPYVRKCACIALTKAYSVDHSQLSELEEILSTLLDDASTMVLGSAISAYNEMCPQNFKLIHPCYRKLCHLLPDMDEWTQAPLLGLMTRYVRTFFTDPVGGSSSSSSARTSTGNGVDASGTSKVKVIKRRVPKQQAFYSDDEDGDSEEEIILEEVETYSPDKRHMTAEMGSVFTGIDADAELGANLDPDHALLLKTSLSLLKSRNACVVLAVCTLHYYCGPRTSITTTQIGKALIRILKNSRETQFVVLSSIKSFAQDDPFTFAPYLSDFFIRLSDPLFNRLLKLDIMASLASASNAEKILKEFQSYIRHHNTTFVCATIRAVGRVADAAPSCAGNCMEGLMHLLYCTSKDKVIDEAVVTLRQLLQQNVDHSPENIKTNITIIHRLVKMLIVEESDDNTGAHVLKMPVARASVVWLVGESYSYLEDISPDILRILASKFADEATQTKTQIANFAVKLGARLPEDVSVQGLMTYVLEMARYDMDIDLRDRSRFMTAMMGLTSLSSDQKDDTGSSESKTTSQSDAVHLTELSSHALNVLLATKLPPATLKQPSVLEDVPDFEIGSLSAMVGHSAEGYVPIPNWSETQLEPHAREEATNKKVSDNALLNRGNSKHKDFDTDNFYDDSEFLGISKKSKISAKDKILSDSDSSSDSSGTNSSDSSDEDSGSDSASEDSEDSQSSDDTSNDESSSSDEDDMYMTTKARTKKVASATPLGSLRRNPVSSAAPTVSTSSGAKPDLLGDMSDSLIPLAQDSFVSNTTHQQNPSADMNLLGFPPHKEQSSNVNFVESGASRLPDQPTSHIQSPSTQSNSDSEILLQMFESFPTAKSENTSQTSASYCNPVSPNTLSNSVSTMEVSRVMNATTTTSVPKVMLRSELSSGLQATFRFRHGMTPSQIPGANCGFIELKNCNSDGYLRRVRPKFQSDVRMTPLDSIPQLAAGDKIDIPVEILLLGREGKKLRVDFSSDRGNFPGEVAFEKWELLFPLCISLQDFNKFKRKLGGFNENICTIQRKSADDEGVILKAILQRVNVFVVDEMEVPSESGDSKIEYCFAACYRRDGTEEKMLIFVSCCCHSGKIQVVVNADDAVMSATMSDYLKKSLSAL